MSTVPTDSRPNGASLWRIPLLLLLTVGAFVAVPMAPASAAPYDIVKYYSIVRWDVGGGDWVPLREGTSTWGRIAARHGYPDPADHCITQVGSNWNRKTVSGTSITFIWDYKAGYNYRVVVQYGSGNQGIITAYSTESPERCW